MLLSLTPLCLQGPLQLCSLWDLALGRGGRKQRSHPFSEEAVSFLRGQAQLGEKTEVSCISEATHIPRQRGTLILPACCRSQLGKREKGPRSSTTDTWALIHQQNFKVRGWVVQSSHLQVQCHCWGLEKEAFHCTSSLVLPMCWGEPSWLLDTVCLGSN